MPRDTSLKHCDCRKIQRKAENEFRNLSEAGLKKKRRQLHYFLIKSKSGSSFHTVRNSGRGRREKRVSRCFKFR
jgi:hypothetical protein